MNPTETGILHPLPEIVRQNKVGERVEQRGQAGDGHRAQALQHCPLRLGQTLRILLQASAAGKLSRGWDRVKVWLEILKVGLIQCVPLIHTAHGYR